MTESERQTYLKQVQELIDKAIIINKELYIDLEKLLKTQKKLIAGNVKIDE